MNHLTELQIELFKRGDIEGLSLFPKQKEALSLLMDRINKDVMFGGAAGPGKSWLGCEWLFFMSNVYPNTRWFIGREELKRIRQSTLITWSKVCQSHEFKKDVDYKLNLQDNYIKLNNGSQIDLLDLRYLPSDPLYERYGSIEYTGGWIEEGGEVHFDAYDTLKSRIGRHMNKELNIFPKLLITTNPKKNWEYTYFYKPWKENTLDSNKAFLPALPEDNPALPDDYIDNLKNLKDKAKKERLLYGNWEYDDDPNWLIDTYDTLLDCFKNHHIEKGIKYITSDIARFGGDKAIIIVWDGWRAINCSLFEKSKTTDISKKIKEFQRQYKVSSRNTIVDSDGVGGGVVDQVGCKGFVNGGKPKYDKNDKYKGRNFNNLKSQCAFKLADIINSDGLFINLDIEEKYKDEIKEELEQLKKEPQDDKKQKLISKDKIKDNIGRSPDWMDTFIMRAYFEIMPTRKVNY